MFKASVFLFFFIGLFISAVGQRKLTGKIVDFKTNVGVPYVSIQLGDTDLGFISDSLGNFNIIIPESQEKIKTITFTSIGYTTKTIPIRKIGNIISLQSKIAFNEEVTVTSTLKVLGRDSSRWGLSFLLLSDNRRNIMRNFRGNNVSYVFLTSSAENINKGPIDEVKLETLDIISAVGRHFFMEKTDHGRLLEVSFRLRSKSIQRSVFRINIVDRKTGYSILKKPVYFNWNEAMLEKQVVSFKDQEINIKSNFIVLLEFLEFEFKPGQKFLDFTISGDEQGGKDEAVFRGVLQHSLQYTKGFIPGVEVKLRVINFKN